MPIREFSAKGSPRAKIGFYPEMPETELARFEERGFTCIQCTEADLRSQTFPGFEFDAIIFSQDPQRLNALGALLQDIAPKLLNYDVRLYARIAPQPGLVEADVPRNLLVSRLLESGVPLAKITSDERGKIPPALREREGSFLAPYVYLFGSGATWVDVARDVCDHPAGPAPNQQLSLGDPAIVDALLGKENRQERELLLRRAFSDCSSLHLARMADGLSGAPAFKAYATLASGLAGGRPYLFFVKLGSRKKITDEYFNYLGRAIEYVPHHLSPRLRLERCNLATSQGILVGDFVEGAEPIRDCAPAGRVGHAISNLFERTLGAWRKHPELDTNLPLSQALREKWLNEENGSEIQLPNRRLALVTQLGGRAEVSTSRAVFDKHSQTAIWSGPAHGDLHATNVLIRAGDAIIIDFERMKEAYPLLYDPASLEGGLLVEGFVNDTRCLYDPKALFHSLLPLYSLKTLKSHVRPCPVTEPSTWFFDCARQIRTLSRHAEHIAGQYALVLALCLLRKGCNPAKLEARYENLRAISFVLGQRILDEFDA